MSTRDYARHKRIKIRKRKILRKKRIISSFAVFTLVLAFILLFSTIAVFAWFARDLPNPNKIQRDEGFSTIIYDRNGEVLYNIFEDENRIPVNLEDIPESLKQATIAIEDKNFYKHEGYSTSGIIRAFVKIITTGSLQGGSTLTQQLVKNVLLTKERTLPRKIKEFILAIQIERKYTKGEILQMYLNEAPYGGTAWGVESAAKQYFDKNVNDLTLLESAILAGLPQRPSVYSPYSGESDAYIARTEHVLRRMREDGYITKDQEKKLKNNLPYVTFSGKKSEFTAPHFVMYVRKLLKEQFGEDVLAKGGLRVTTTIDSSIQNSAEEIVNEELEKIEKLHVGNGAVVILDPNTGEIIAMVGSRDFSAGGSENSEEGAFGGQFNVAVQGLRQPGSSIKPIVYATAFQKGYTPSTMIMDVPTEFPSGDPDKPYRPENYNGKFQGPVQMRFALGNSINVIAVKTLALVGVKNMLTNAYNMGLTTLEPSTENVRRFGLSIALGGGEVTLLELTGAYGVFATGGTYNEPIAILKVENNNGDTLFEHKVNKGKQALSREVSFLVSHILSDNNARKDIFGANSWLNIGGKTVAAKTGTTDDKRDNWTLGFTKDIVVGVWVGNNDNSPMDPKLASGVSGAAPIWNRIMREVLKEYKDGIIDKPEGVIAMEVDAYGGALPKNGQPTRSEYFIKGMEPASVSPIYQTLKLSRRQSGKLASEDEIRVGDYDEKEFIVFYEDDPISTDGINRWQNGIDKWLEGIEDERYHPPKDVSDVKIEEEPTSTPTPTKSPENSPTPTLEKTPTPSHSPIPTTQ